MSKRWAITKFDCISFLTKNVSHSQYLHQYLDGVHYRKWTAWQEVYYYSCKLSISQEKKCKKECIQLLFQKSICKGGKITQLKKRITSRFYIVHVAASFQHQIVLQCQVIMPKVHQWVRNFCYQTEMMICNVRLQNIKKFLVIIQ